VSLTDNFVKVWLFRYDTPGLEMTVPVEEQEFCGAICFENCNLVPSLLFFADFESGLRFFLF
jgi:hypothetical protein